MFRKLVFTLTATLFIILLFSSQIAMAEVYTEKTDGGKSDTIYVAGNPNLYPVEYYDADSCSYKGLIPDLLNEVSAKTGISFTYISAGNKNHQKSLFKNKQVELITAITSDDSTFKDVDSIAVLTTEIHGDTVEYYIGFTDIISQSQKNTIMKALSEISYAEKSGMLINTAQNDLLSSQKRLFIVISVVALITVIIALIVLVIVINNRKKKLLADNMIDPETGVGNVDYYIYAFDNLISPQAKSLYNLAYISLDFQSFEMKKSDASIEDIEKYAATKLSSGLLSGDYLSHIKKGVFLLLFQAENAEIADSRMLEMVLGVNRYISEYVNDSYIIFRSGYCRFYDDMSIDAETAVYNAKQGYEYAVSKEIHHYISSNIELEKNSKIQKLTQQIDTALENKDFKVYMQFFLDGKTDKLCGAEVLSRWQNQEFGLLRPDEYIDLLSKTGKIVEHDYMIFEEVCSLLEKWNKPPFDRLFLSCNFTRLSASNSDFAKTLIELSNKYNFSPNRLVVEVTENSLNTNSEVVSENIKKLSTFGFKVAIDDMGAGFSSLADIYDNEIDIVKIERNFVASCVTQRRRRMLSNIILLVHNAGAKVICEGVETAEQLQMLKDIDCDMMQGFYKSRVLPLSEGEKFFLAQ